MFTSFKDMSIWREAMAIAEEVFELTEAFPRKEDFGLTSQLRRSILSISANIAEAYGRNHSREKVNFYYYERGSVTESQSHLEYSKRVGYIDKNIAEVLDARLHRLYNDLNKVILSLKF